MKKKKKKKTGSDIGRLFVVFLSHWQPDENDKSEKKKKINELTFIIILTVQGSL